MRLNDWEQRLDQAIRAGALRPFAWGEHDCATFVRECVLAVRGVDIGTWGRYRTERGALRVIAGKTGRIATVADQILCDAGCRPVMPHRAGRGDIVLFGASIAFGGILGVVDLTGRRVVAPGPDGLLSAAPATALRAWRV